jgi:protein-disulfide isomerase
MAPVPALDPPLRDDDHVAGDPGAPLVLVMYGEFQCPFCTAAQGSLRRVRERLGDRLRFVFRHFPLREVHPDAERAAQASEAAAAQDAFWPMHDALYAARGALGEDDVVRAAAGLGLDDARVRDDLREGLHAARVERDLQDALRMGLPGTPAFFANGERVEGAFDARSLIDALEG